PGPPAKNLTPRPPSLRGKGEQELSFPPLRFGEGGRGEGLEKSPPTRSLGVRARDPSRRQLFFPGLPDQAPAPLHRRQRAPQQARDLLVRVPLQFPQGEGPHLLVGQQPQQPARLLRQLRSQRRVGLSPRRITCGGVQGCRPPPVAPLPPLAL